MDKITCFSDEDAFKVTEKTLGKTMITSPENYPDEHIHEIEDYDKPISENRTEDYFSKLVRKAPDVEEIERTKTLIAQLNTKRR